jgi:hypothetical protein
VECASSGSQSWLLELDAVFEFCFDDLSFGSLDSFELFLELDSSELLSKINLRSS